MKSILTATIIATLTGTVIAQEKQHQPNIVFFFIDDMGWKDLGCFGAKLYETPNIDALCAEGMKFTAAYTTAPICSPARASALSGRHSLDLQMWNHLHHIPQQTVVLPQLLKQSGYTNWHVGKWHTGSPKTNTMPKDFSFDVNIGGGTSFGPHSYFWPFGASPKGKQMNRHQGVPGLAPKYKKGDQLTESLTKEAIKLIQQHKSESPFFLNFWYYCVHNKHGAHKHLVNKYRDKINQLGIKEEQNRICPVTGVSLHTTPSYPTYAAMIETLDQSVGDIVKTLKKQKKYDNTLFVFFSDNGPVTNQAPCVPLMGGKNSTYEAGVRVPAFICWPGHTPKGSTSDHPISVMDIMPTLLAAAKLSEQAPAEVEGISLLPLFHGKSLPDRDFFWYFPDTRERWAQRANIAIRDKQGFKYIHFFTGHPPELYNLNTDIGETKNILSQHPEKATTLRKLCQRYLQQRLSKLPKPPQKYANAVRAFAENE